MIKIEILLRHVVFLFSHIILSSGNNLLIVLSKPQPLLTTNFLQSFSCRIMSKLLKNLIYLVFHHQLQKRV
jgi:hypothetical protein